MHRPNYLFHFSRMDNFSSLDYIIVGQGLAGSAIALQLLKAGKKIVVIDEAARNASSRVAAGLFNPVTGKNPVKTWQADELFPYLHRFYKEAEIRTGKRFFFEKSLYRPFNTIHEQNDWMGKSADEAYRDYIADITTTPGYGKDIKDPFGGLLLKQCGYLNTQAYLEAVRQYISSESIFIEDRLDLDQLEFGVGHVVYSGWQARQIIFCQGERSGDNKWFRDLPIRPLKGEILTIKSEWHKDVILNRGVYMVPGGAPGEYRVGSTYNNDGIPGISERGRVELEEKLRELVQFPYMVMTQEWGLRPTTADRRPILGCHPENDRLVIFNGLGTKGVSLAPYFSEVLFRWLENKEPLNKEVSITRYK